MLPANCFYDPNDATVTVKPSPSPYAFEVWVAAALSDPPHQPTHQKLMARWGVPGPIESPVSLEGSWLAERPFRVRLGQAVRGTTHREKRVVAVLGEAAWIYLGVYFFITPERLQAIQARRAEILAPIGWQLHRRMEEPWVDLEPVYRGGQPNEGCFVTVEPLPNPVTNGNGEPVINAPVSQGKSVV